MSPVSLFDQDRDGNEEPAGAVSVDPGSKQRAGESGAGTRQTDSHPDPDLTGDQVKPEYVRIRPAWYRIGRGLILVGAFVWFGMLVVGKVQTWFDHQLDPAGEPEEAVTVIIQNGATTANIGRQLQDQEIIPNSTFFRYYAEWNDEGNFQAGEYVLYTNSSAQEAIDILNLGPEPQLFQRFTIREGLWIDEILPEIAAQLDGVSESELRTVLNTGQILPRYRPEGETSWEGLLFPDTYEISEEADALEVLLKMSDEFSKVSGDLSYGTADTPLNLSAYEVLIVASLIEAETRVPEERPLVASVIYNRLREREPLGIDATCIYGTGDRRVELTREILDEGGPYGCRGVLGLPPTPINSPSKASLAAAIAPEETTFMFYVLTDPSGRHTFTETIEEFNEAKKICQEQGLC